jgi:drug/metabolite transporter (DMT)-like permease
MACFVKLATASGLPSSELVFLRAVFQGSLVVLALFWYTDPNVGENDLLIVRPFGSKTVRLVVIARGVVGGLGFLLYYHTYSVLPLGDAVTILSLSPVITIPAAAVFLKEKIRISHIFATVASLVGSILLARPSFLFGRDESNNNNQPDHSSTGYLTGILGACCGATVYILMRRAGKEGVHTLQLLFSWCIFGFLYSFAFGLLLPMAVGLGNPFVVPPTQSSWMYVSGVCVFGSMGHFLLNYAGRYAPAGLGSIVRSSGIMWSYLLEVLVFHQVPQKSTILGVSLILVSLVTIAIEKHQSDRQRKSSQEEDNDVESLPLQLKSNSYGSTSNSENQPITNAVVSKEGKQ